MNYESAIQAIQVGKHVRRAAWEEPPVFLTLSQNIGEDYPAGFIYSVEVGDGAMYFPWVPTEGDKAAVDWEETEWIEY
jgi:hypothetical protein